MIRKTVSVIVLMAMLLLSACASATSGNSVKIRHRYASKAEGTELLLSNQAYYSGFSQNDLDYKMKKKNATMDEYLALAREQVLDFTDREKALLDDYFASMNQTLKEEGYSLP